MEQMAWFGSVVHKVLCVALPDHGLDADGVVGTQTMQASLMPAGVKCLKKVVLTSTAW